MKDNNFVLCDFTTGTISRQLELNEKLIVARLPRKLKKGWKKKGLIWLMSK